MQSVVCHFDKICALNLHLIGLNWVLGWQYNKTSLGLYLRYRWGWVVGPWSLRLDFGLRTTSDSGLSKRKVEILLLHGFKNASTCVEAQSKKKERFLSILYHHTSIRIFPPYSPSKLCLCEVGSSRSRPSGQSKAWCFCLKRLQILWQEFLGCHENSNHCELWQLKRLGLIIKTLRDH